MSGHAPSHSHAYQLHTLNKDGTYLRAPTAERSVTNLTPGSSRGYTDHDHDHDHKGSEVTSASDLHKTPSASRSDMLQPGVAGSWGGAGGAMRNGMAATAGAGGGGGGMAGRADGSGGEEEGDPIITTGMDVSLYLVSFVDEGDPALTFRGFVLGNFFLLLSSVVGYVSAVPFAPLRAVGAMLTCFMLPDWAATQIYSLKPVTIQLSQVFIQLAIWILGMGWAKLLPTTQCIRRSSRFAL